MKKILIADDEHKIVMTLEYAFRKAGYEVFIARDGTEVLELLKEQIPDLILLDIMMPNLDGYSTLSEIKKTKKFQNLWFTRILPRFNEQLSDSVELYTSLAKPLFFMLEHCESHNIHKLQDWMRRILDNIQQKTVSWGIFE